MSQVTIHTPVSGIRAVSIDGKQSNYTVESGKWGYHVCILEGGRFKTTLSTHPTKRLAECAIHQELATA